MHVLAICAGIGGLEIGLKLATGNAARTVAIIEREGYCASVLRARMQDGSLDDCPIWSDVKTFDPEPWRGRVDCITAGFPCQPFSTAGRRKGEEDPRHLWPYIADIIRVLRPRYVFCENVSGHLSLGFEQVCRELCEMGYGVEAGIFSAAEVGAPHLRKRLFFLAHLADPEHGRRRPERADGQPVGGPNDCVHASGPEDGSRLGDGSEDVADARRSHEQDAAKRCPVVKPQDGLSHRWNADKREFGRGSADVADPHSDGRRSGLRPQQLCATDAAAARSGEDNGRAIGAASRKITRPAHTLADPDSDGQRGGRPVECGPPHAAPAQCCADVADSHAVRQIQQDGAQHEERRRASNGSDGAGQGPAERRLDVPAARHADLVDHLTRGWPADWEDGVPRVAENQPHRVDRLRALGNAVVPQTAALAWTTLMQQASAHGTSDM